MDHSAKDSPLSPVPCVAEEEEEVLATLDVADLCATPPPPPPPASPDEPPPPPPPTYAEVTAGATARAQTEEKQPVLLFVDVYDKEPEAELTELENACPEGCKCEICSAEVVVSDDKRCQCMECVKHATECKCEQCYTRRYPKPNANCKNIDLWKNYPCCCQTYPEHFPESQTCNCSYRCHKKDSCTYREFCSICPRMYWYEKCNHLDCTQCKIE